MSKRAKILSLERYILGGKICKLECQLMVSVMGKLKQGRGGQSWVGSSCYFSRWSGKASPRR